MKTIILAGGLGTRLSEETVAIPKPMVTIGGKPILWHIMKTYSHYGYRDFVLALGYKGDVIKEWLLGLEKASGSFEIDLATGETSTWGDKELTPWTVLALETGAETQTGGRVRRAISAISDEEVMLTYGDGVADIDLDALVAFHRQHGRLATVTAVRPPARFGRLEVRDGAVTRFGEKLQSEEGWINGGFFVLRREVVDYIPDDSSPFESTALVRLADRGELMAYEHEGFWQPMDTLRERHELEALWATGRAPWAV